MPTRVGHAAISRIVGRADWTWFGLVKHEAPPPPPVESLVLRGDGIEAAKAPLPGTAAARLAGATSCCARASTPRPKRSFAASPTTRRIRIRLAEEARYYQAECLRLQKYYPEAADTYAALLNKFPNNPYREQAVQHMFDIANYWLDDTRQEIERAGREARGQALVRLARASSASTRASRSSTRRAGPSSCWSRSICTTSTARWPTRRCSGAARSSIYNEDFREADYYFTQIHERHPNSPLAAQAVELAIIAKHISTGGADYDGRKSAEARNLVQAALRNYPELPATRRSAKIPRTQLASINDAAGREGLQDGRVLQRHGPPGVGVLPLRAGPAALPRTKFAELATGRMDEVARRGRKGTKPVGQADGSDVPCSLPRRTRCCPQRRRTPACADRRWAARRRRCCRKPCSAEPAVPAAPGRGSALARRSKRRIAMDGTGSRHRKTRTRRSGEPASVPPAAAGLRRPRAVVPACARDGNFTLLGYTHAPNYDATSTPSACRSSRTAPIHAGGLELDLTEAVVREIELKTPYKVVGAERATPTPS